MMTCSECRNLLVDYADDHLADADMQAHLARCADCRMQAAQERRLSALLHGAMAAAPEQGLLIWPARPAPSGRVRVALAAAAVACLMGAVVCWWSAPMPPGETVASDALTRPAANTSEQSFTELEAEIAREAIAARLVASAESLAAEPAVDGYALEAMRFVAEAFPDTHAGREAARRAGLKESHAKEQL